MGLRTRPYLVLPRCKLMTEGRIDGPTLDLVSSRVPLSWLKTGTLPAEDSILCNLAIVCNFILHGLYLVPFSCRLIECAFDFARSKMNFIIHNICFRHGIYYRRNFRCVRYPVISLTDLTLKFWGLHPP